MSIQEAGRAGEAIARVLLKNDLHVDAIMQADWLVQKSGIWYVVEVKYKERFKAPPFDGHGLDGYQADSRMRFFRDTGIRCLLLVIDANGADVYWQWLDILEGSEYHTTRNDVRIYDLRNFAHRDRKRLSA